MSAFQDFIQTELPKRPYLNADVAAESIIIRRGAGPRQLGAVTFTEGQILVMNGGQLVAMSLSAIAALFGGGLRSFVLPVPVASDTWTVTHNLNSENVIIQAFDEGKFVILPNTIQIVSANVVTLTFNTAQVGVARVVFLD